MKKLRIGFIGNFQVPYTTENDRRWSLEKLGHEVVTFQENQTSDLTLRLAGNQLDLLIYSHTHGWKIPDLKEVFDHYKKIGVPTVSVHLDRWAGLERQSDIGIEATWFTEYLFMADFSPEAQELYNKIGHKKVFYLKPGVVERDCYMAQPDRVKYPHDIIFVGSKGYHPEYPFRPQLITFLQETYGDRFGHYGNDGIRVVRGHDLNTLYASAKIAVGDSCFGGRPNYVSDRYYETRGRGGFLIHPLVEGVDDKGVYPYNGELAQNNLEIIKGAIEVCLADDEMRESYRQLGFEYVRGNQTYTNRMAEMLGVIFK